MPVTSHYYFVNLCLRIGLALSNISIVISLYPQLEGDQLDTGSNLCTIFSINSFMYK